jgi:hypothetical protein
MTHIEAMGWYMKENGSMSGCGMGWQKSNCCVLPSTTCFCTWPAPTLSPTSLMARLFSSQTPSPVIHQHSSNPVHSTYAYLPVKMEQTECSERRHINFRRRGITQKKAYKRYFMCQDWKDWHWGPANFLFSMSTHFHVMLKLRMSGAAPPLLRVLMACCSFSCMDNRIFLQLILKIKDHSPKSYWSF